MRWGRERSPEGGQRPGALHPAIRLAPPICPAPRHSRHHGTRHRLKRSGFDHVHFISQEGWEHESPPLPMVNSVNSGRVS